MRFSCNGCRVLRKGCAEDCILRPCLQWIKSSESQSNATVFLAKFYGRAGLINLINAGPEHLRPVIFRSLLYEACGRMINPIYGSVGLLWSSNWDHCQAAVDAVLNGMPIMQVPADATAAPHPIMPLKDCDIRHLSLTKDSLISKPNEPHRVYAQTRFKRVGGRGRGKGQLEGPAEPARFSVSGWGGNHPEELNRVPSLDSSVFSAETVEVSLANRDVKLESKAADDDEESEVALELSLGLNPVLCSHPAPVEDQSVAKVSGADA